jgi:dipeptidyl aminopeptidase/acylaminoacyl peptidase
MPTGPSTPFHDLDHVNALPRVSGLAMSPDGARLVTTVATVSGDGTAFRTALWEVDPAGERPAVRLTRSAKGEAGAAFDGDGDLWFTSARPDPDGDDDGEPRPALWLLPRAGGEARLVLRRPGGVSSVHAASAAAAVFVMADLMPGATTEDDDAALREERSKAKVSAILHDGYPIRFWDHDLGPGQPHLHAVRPVRPSRADAAVPGTVDRAASELRDLTPGVGPALLHASPRVAPDGSFVLVGSRRELGGADSCSELVRVDVRTRRRRVLATSPDVEYFPGPVSPDGARAVVGLETRSTPLEAPRVSLAVVDLASGDLARLAPEWDRWPIPLAWFPDGRSVLVVAADDGRAPLFRVEVATGAVTRLTDDDAAYSAACVHPDGTTVFGVRSGYGFPPEVVRVDVASGEVTRLEGPAERPRLPGRLTEVETTAPDGARVRAWLALPRGASRTRPAPLVLWIHGGPLGSWNEWSWRWLPWNLVAQGYAVLLPDPRLSVGYGQDFVQRGWGRWGSEPYTDLMAVTDAAEARPDVDETRTAAMGGSFGGYMANWVAGHTDRFRAIVTHASLWALDAFGPTTDAAHYWQREMTPEMSVANSPHLHVGEIVTPMLVVHGDKDYRVPIGEGLRLWYDLLARSGRPAAADGSTDHRFLYFPDENHWILTPQHAKVWYETVLGFLSRHVLGTERPAARGLGLEPPSDSSDAGVPG